MNFRLKQKLRRELENRADDCIDEYGMLDVDAVLDLVEEVMDGKLRLLLVEET